MVVVEVASTAVVVAAVAIAKKEVKYGGGRFFVRRLFVCDGGSYACEGGLAEGVESHRVPVLARQSSIR
jgi:hypothetical protein